jgi:hypothetical protein
LVTYSKTDKARTFTHGANGTKKLQPGIDLRDVTVAADLQSFIHHLQGIILTQENDVRLWGDSSYLLRSLDPADARETNI